MKKSKKCVLILTANTGSGHQGAANALQSAFVRLYGDDVKCVIADPMSHQGAPGLIRRVQTNYDNTVLRREKFYSWCYRGSDFNRVSRIVMRVMGMVMYYSINRAIEEHHPDAIVSTFHLYNGPVEAVLRKRRLSIPHDTVVTDLGKVHKLWFTHNSDRLFVGSDWVQKEAIASGFNPERIRVHGIPVDAGFQYPHPEKATLRKQLGWQTDPVTILVVGGNRVRNLMPAIQAIARSGYPVQIVVAAGGDEQLYTECLQQSEWPVPVWVYDYVENLAHFILASDLVVSKPGGLICTESLAGGVPMIWVNSLPGQEAGNASYLIGRGCGSWATTPEEMQRVLDGLLRENAHKLKIFKANARKAGYPDSSELIARSVWSQMKRTRKLVSSPELSVRSSGIFSEENA